jgi:hypothetical protein
MNSVPSVSKYGYSTTKARRARGSLSDHKTGGYYRMNSRPPGRSKPATTSAQRQMRGIQHSAPIPV